MANIINDNYEKSLENGRGVKTAEQIAAEIARNRAEAERQRKIADLKAKIKKLEKEIRELEKKRKEYNVMIEGIATAVQYLGQAISEASGLPNIIPSSYKGSNSESYVSQISACGKEFSSNRAVLENVSRVAGEKIKNLEKKIAEKTKQKAKYGSELRHYGG